MELLDDSFISKDEHYLSKYGFCVIDKEQINTPVGGNGITTYKTVLTLSDFNTIWTVRIDTQHLQFNQISYKEVSGKIQLGKIATELHIQTQNSFFSVFLNKTKLSNFYSIKGDQESINKHSTLKTLLLEFRDKYVDIHILNNQIEFKFYFSNYFVDEYYDTLYNLLKEITIISQ